MKALLEIKNIILTLKTLWFIPEFFIDEFNNLKKYT